MRDNDARTVCLWKEKLCNNGENKVWFGNFKRTLGVIVLTLLQTGMK